MKRNPLPSAEDLLSRLSYNEQTGALYWLRMEGDGLKARQWNAQFAGKRAGGVSPYGYRLVKFGNKVFHASRLIWRIKTGCDPAQFDIDHIDRRKDNNAFCNLRLATRTQNIANSGLRKDNVFAAKGISIAPSGRFQARITKGGVTRSLGVFASREEAAAAYSRAASSDFGEFAGA